MAQEMTQHQQQCASLWAAAAVLASCTQQQWHEASLRA
jgi:hypothetical protein